MEKLFYFARELRTASSERFNILSLSDTEKVGTADLHYKLSGEVYVTLLMFAKLDNAQLDRLIKDMDDDIIDAADIAKGNLFIKCYGGKEYEGFSVEKEWNRPRF